MARDIGAFRHKSMLLVDIETKSVDGSPIALTHAVEVDVIRSELDGEVTLDRVTLKELEPGHHTATIYVDDNWMPGSYRFIYHLMLEDDELTFEEVGNLVEEISEPEPIFDLEDDDEQWVMPSDYQIPSTIEVSGRDILITPTLAPAYNEYYTVVMDKQIQSVNGSTLPSKQTFSFSSEYAPIFGTPKAVASILKSLFSQFTTDDVYIALRDAGQKIHQLKELVPDANNARFRPMQERDEAYFPAQKYGPLAAAKSLLSSLLIKLINQEDEGQIGTKLKGGSFTLGDFTVSDGSSGSNSDTKEESPLVKIQQLIDSIDKELVFWRDAMMNRNRRGYTSPGSAEFRTDGGTPESRDF